MGWPQFLWIAAAALHLVNVVQRRDGRFERVAFVFGSAVLLWWGGFLHG